MKIYHAVKRNELEKQLKEKGVYAQKGGVTHCCTINSKKLLDSKLRESYDDPSERVWIEADDLNPALDVRYEKGKNNQICFPRAYRPIKEKDITAILSDADFEDACTHVLMNTSDLSEKWIRPKMRKLIDPKDRVCILAASYYDDTKSLDDWNRQFSKVNGMFFRGYQDPFLSFGLKPEQIVWVNPFQDSNEAVKDKLVNSNIVVLPGGAPDLFMKRIRKMKLKKLLEEYNGLMIGVSAGAMIQLEDYHISPDEDYADFSMQKGLRMLKNLDVEVHFRNTPVQLESIEKAKEIHGFEVYALFEDGALVFENGQIELWGNARLY